MIGDAELRSGLVEHWGVVDAVVRGHDGGMNSATWFVTAGGERRVAKAVAPRARRSFAAGLALAVHVDAAGIPAGSPVPTRRGDLVADVDGIPLALLEWVGGTASSGATGGHRLIGRTLGRVHAALLDAPAPELDRFHWLDPGAAHLAVRPWVRPAVAAVVTAYDAADPAGFTWGPLHGDPAPEAFRSDAATGRHGLIDWGSAVRGPLLYDLASAVMYVGGAARAGALVEAYLDGRTVTAAEVERGLPVMSRFRWAVQADYFAHRLATGDLTGVSDSADNEKGLEDARRALLEPSS